MRFLLDHILPNGQVENFHRRKQCGNHIKVDSCKLWASSVYMSKLSSCFIVVLGTRPSCFRLTRDAIDSTNTEFWLDEIVNLACTKYLILTRPSFLVMQVSQGHCVGWWRLSVVRRDELLSLRTIILWT